MPGLKIDTHLALFDCALDILYNNNFFVFAENRCVTSEREQQQQTKTYKYFCFSVKEDINGKHIMQSTFFDSHQ